MPSACAACQTPFTKERRGLKCTLCDERRVAEPAYYCNRACQKQHWPEHKAFHAQIAAGVDLTSRKERPQDATLDTNGVTHTAPSTSQ